MSSYGVGPIPCDAIKKEIFTYGSVIADFTISEDLLTYGSGVYRHLTGTAEGHHANKCISWVVKNGQDYWLCVNSWSITRGDQGTFKIFMGDRAINFQKNAGNNKIASHLTATQNVQKKDLKVRSDSKKFKTLDQTDGDFEITPTAATPALVSTQACEDTVRPESKTAACDPADQICFNS